MANLLKIMAPKKGVKNADSRMPSAHSKTLCFFMLMVMSVGSLLVSLDRSPVQSSWSFWPAIASLLGRPYSPAINTTNNSETDSLASQQSNGQVLTRDYSSNTVNTQQTSVPIQTTMVDITFPDVLITPGDQLRHHASITSQETKQLSHSEEVELGLILRQKLKDADVKEHHFRPTCVSEVTRGNSCPGNHCLSTSLPEDPVTRVAELIKPRQLRLTDQHKEVLREMSDQVDGFYDIILSTAASSNHYLESQALLRNVHTHLYPFLKNFTMVYYNLGLTQQQKAMVAKFCRCQVLNFPFHKFPPFVQHLRCYSWKSIIIKAVLQKGQVVIWMDSSVRFDSHIDRIHDLIDKARRRGIMSAGTKDTETAFRTHQAMFRFFGDEPCAHLHLKQAASGFGLYHQEPLIDRALMEPWVACSLNKSCICPVSPGFTCRESMLMEAKVLNGSGPIIYGLCHRFDQSAFSVILHKLYQGKLEWIMVVLGDIVRIARGDLYTYFPEHGNYSNTSEPPDAEELMHVV